MTARLPASAHLELKTPQLFLRAITDTDVGPLSRALSMPGVGAFLALRTSTAAEVNAELGTRVGAWHTPDQTSFTFAIRTSDRSDPIGMVTVTREQSPHRATVSDMVIDPRHASTGYGLEAGRAAIAFAFALPGVQRVWALRHHRNTAGAALFRSVGMTEEGLLRGWLELDGQLVDVFCHSVLREDWSPTESERALYLQCRSALNLLVEK